MQAVILAAGKSSRFIPFSNLPHKSMVSLLGKPILAHTILSLTRAGIDSVVVVVSKESKIPEILAEYVGGIDITYVVQESPTGMGDGLLAAREKLDDSFFLLNAYHVDAHEFTTDIKNVDRSADEVVLLCKNDADLNRHGIVTIDGDYATSVTEKAGEISSGSRRIIGIYLLPKNFLSTLESTLHEEYSFESALDQYAKQSKVKFFETDKETVSLKYAWDILDVKNYLFKGIKKNISADAEISDHSIIEGEVFIEAGAKVMEQAVIKGPAYIGKDAYVGSHALLRDGVNLEEGSVAGSYMEIKNAVVGKRSTTHSGFIGDSVIGLKCKIGAQICTGNVRLNREHIISRIGEFNLDTGKTQAGTIIGDNCVLGVRSTIMPGVILGNDVTVGPDTIVLKNVEDNTLYYAKYEGVVEKTKHDA